MRVYAHTCMHTIHLHICAAITRAHVHMRMPTHACRHTHLHMQTHTLAHADTLTLTHARSSGMQGSDDDFSN